MEELQWAKDTAKKLKEKMEKVVERNLHTIPYTAKNGSFDDWTKKDIYWWTNGFYGGILWQMYAATKEERYKNTAIELEEKLEQNLRSYRGMDHDSGFKWLLTAAANYRFTGNETSFDRMLIAAGSLAGRYNPAGNFIRAWNDNGDGSNAGVAIIDCMMNLPLLYWASENSKDPRFEQIARLHADMAEKQFVREDGSVNHIVQFNPATGERIKSVGGQGYGHGSSWTRGQAWAIYGFCLSYLHTKEKRYLNTAKRVANYFLENIPESGLIPIDFRQPKEPAWEDSTAAAIAACGLLEIEKYVDEYEKPLFHNGAIKLLKALEENRCNWSKDADNLLEKCSAAYHDKEHEFPIIYGDYFFIEAVWKLTGEESFMW